MRCRLRRVSITSGGHTTRESSSGRAREISAEYYQNEKRFKVVVWYLKCIDAERAACLFALGFIFYDDRQ